MPDKNGWHDTPISGGEWVWHYCKGAEVDALVRNNERERKLHLKTCVARQKAEARQQANLTAKRRREILKVARSMRGV